MFLGNFAFLSHVSHIKILLLFVIYFPLGYWLRYQIRWNSKVKESHYLNVCFAVRGTECKKISLHRGSMNYQTFAWAQELLLTREWTDPSANSIRNISSWNIHEVSAFLSRPSPPVLTRLSAIWLTEFPQRLWKHPTAVVKVGRPVSSRGELHPKRLHNEHRPERGKAVV